MLQEQVPQAADEIERRTTGKQLQIAETKSEEEKGLEAEIRAGMPTPTPARPCREREPSPPLLRRSRGGRRCRQALHS